jgi:hypothetical protein
MHTPRFTDDTDPKKAVKQLKQSMDDAYLLINRLETKVDKLNSSIGAVQGQANVTVLTSYAPPLPPSPIPGVPDYAWAWFIS